MFNCNKNMNEDNTDIIFFPEKKNKKSVLFLNFKKFSEIVSAEFLEINLKLLKYILQTFDFRAELCKLSTKYQFLIWVRYLI